MKIMRFITLYIVVGLGLSFLLSYNPDSAPLVFWGAVILLGICFGYLIVHYGSIIKRKLNR